MDEIDHIIDAEGFGEAEAEPKRPYKKAKYKRVGRVVACALCHSQRGTFHKLPGEDGKYFCDNCFKYLTDGKFPK